ncbi:hypothetical protein ATCV1_z359L [Acanthocystis turfacea chlorella virus 1]|uniref:Uncharacterized protein z359L n=1 Tax=Chlorovirus heliozoae TaxID=322019 RepID=A7K8W9_9PHYC|nr:hypothetical protein ATCV1_z359L [Acanthocystis turfacea chlorella virus 1]ABT16493.1 hypothetical protein ATCV1_z359L [Acanthocystis turfacea chlorella virus 1]
MTLAVFNARPDSAAIASLSLKLSETMRAAMLISRNTKPNLNRLRTVGGVPPTRKMIAEYAMMRNPVSTTA